MVVSIGVVGSASGAAAYYAADNYYLVGDQVGIAEWGGKGARAQGLEGPVDVLSFERVLDGALPNGDQISGGADGHRPGIDLTFSAPKSVSLVALVGGDERVLQAHARSVSTAMGWAEANLAEARRGKNGHETVQTGSLIYATFTHNVSRSLDPQLHSHVVVANATERPDGSWRALKNDQLFQENTLIASIYHAQLRVELNKLGYATELTGKHGTFEIRGISREMIEAWSTRSAEIRDKAAEMGIESPQGLRAVAARSRDEKQPITSAELKAHWAATAERNGTNLAPIIEAAREASRPRGLLEQVRAWGHALLDRITAAFGPKPEPLMRGAEPAKRSPSLAAAYAVAAGVRHLGERNASFEPRQLLRAALNFADHGAGIATVEARIHQLVADRALLLREHDGRPYMTTPDILKTERALVQHMQQGIGAAQPAISSERIGAELDRAATMRGLTLSEEQVTAASAILSERDKIQILQGDAGSGKSTLFEMVRDIAERGGVEVRALTPQNKLGLELHRDSGIAVETVAAFLVRHEKVARGSDPKAIANARAEMGGKLLIVDEASMISHRQMAGLMEIAAKADIAKLVLVGDVRQIDPVEAGRPFALLQDKDAPVARLSENRRQLVPELGQAVAHARQGRVTEALHALGGRVREAYNPSIAAAKSWLALTVEDRERTALFSSGHRLRHEMLLEVRSGLLKEGKLGSKAVILKTLEPLHRTTEELRRIETYKKGQTLDVYRFQSRAGLERGSYAVVAVDRSKNMITLDKDGKRSQLDPSEIAPNSRGLALSETAEIEVRLGDRLMWTANDKAQAIANGATADVVALNQHSMTLQDQHGEVTLRLDDPMAQRLTHGLVLNMHKAQGLTVDRAITVMESSDRALNSQSLFYVLSSRAREDMHIFTDDKAKLAQHIEQHQRPAPNASELDGGKQAAPLGAIPEQPIKSEPVKDVSRELELTKDRELDRSDRAPSIRYDMDLGL